MADINLRPDLTRHLQQRLAAFQDGFRHNLALIGPPGSGKTFQIQRLIAQPPPETLVIYCPVYRESCRSFLQRLACAILHNGLGDPTGQSFEELLDRAAEALPRTTGAMRPITHLLARGAYGEAFNRALDGIPVLTEERRQRVLLVLDEFLFLEELGLAHAFHELGKRVMVWPSVLFILASSSPYRARRILRERLQLLFGQFELLTLDTLDAHRVAAWVQQELRGLRRKPTLSPFLVWWLGASPRYLAAVLNQLKALAALGQRSDITEALFLESVWDVLGSPEGSLSQWCATRLEPLAHVRYGTRAVEALVQIADGARTASEIGQRVGRAGLSAALQVLVERDLAERNGTCWMVHDPILRCWLSTIFWTQRHEASPTPEKGRGRLERYLQSLWATWMQLQHQSLSEQVAHLLTQFREETVSLDQKTGRLPCFQRIAAQPDGSTGSYLVAEGEGKRWCCAVIEESITEQRIATFEAFCRAQRPRPVRKVIVAPAGLEDNATLLAKAANMWVWGSKELATLGGLYVPPGAVS